MTKVFALNEGFYSVDNSKQFIPFNPSIHNPKDRPASLFVHVQPFLIDLGTELILLDTGLGFKNEQNELIIHENIKNLGYHPDGVSKVLMSHLHFDHAGGMMQEVNGNWEPSFPNADYFIHSDEMAYALSKESKSYKKELLEEIRRFSGLQLINSNDGWISSNIYYEQTGAHCPYHQIFKIVKDEQIYFYGADVMPEAHQVLRKIIAKYDFDGRKAMELREEFAKQAIAEHWKCLMYHDHRNGIVEFENFEDGIRIKSSLFSIE